MDKDRAWSSFTSSSSGTEHGTPLELQHQLQSIQNILFRESAANGLCHVAQGIKEQGGWNRVDAVGAGQLLPGIHGADHPKGKVAFVPVQIGARVLFQHPDDKQPTEGVLEAPNAAQPEVEPC